LWGHEGDVTYLAGCDASAGRQSTATKVGEAAAEEEDDLARRLAQLRARS
jgi:hypothetical protein